MSLRRNNLGHYNIEVKGAGYATNRNEELKETQIHVVVYSAEMKKFIVLPKKLKRKIIEVKEVKEQVTNSNPEIIVMKTWTVPPAPKWKSHLPNQGYYAIPLRATKEQAVISTKEFNATNASWINFIRNKFSIYSELFKNAWIGRKKVKQNYWIEFNKNLYKTELLQLIEMQRRMQESKAYLKRKAKFANYIFVYEYANELTIIDKRIKQVQLKISEQNCIVDFNSNLLEMELKTENTTNNALINDLKILSDLNEHKITLQNNLTMFTANLILIDHHIQTCQTTSFYYENCIEYNERLQLYTLNDIQAAKENLQMIKKYILILEQSMSKIK